MKRCLFVFLLLTPIAHAHENLCDWPVPSYQIGEFDQTHGIKKKSYDAMLDRVETVYAPIFEAFGCKLDLIRSWSNGEINSQAWQDGIKGVNMVCHVEMFGGLARYKWMTSASEAAVACHEIGHHLGGFPYYSGELMSVEGQADYFATLECMKRVGVASAAASLALTKVLADLGEEPLPSRATRAKEVVKTTIQDHPRAQCRLDTYDAGRLNAERPRCWYAGN